MRRTMRLPKGKIEKPEDKAWQEWYENLDLKEHEQHLRKLGLDESEIKEWEELEGFKKKPAKKK